MKCDSCGKTIEDANALTCPFCNAELKSPEEIEVLDDEPKEESVPEETTEKVEESTEEVEEAKEEKVEEEVEVKEEPKVEETIEPSIISSEEISIDSIGVEKPKKKKNKKKKDKDASEEEENKEEPKEEVKEEQTEEKPQEEEKVEETPQNEEKVQEEQAEEKSKEEEKVEEIPQEEVKEEPFVEAENVVPLPPKKTLGYRIKDFYRSMFEGYEKLPEIKVDDRETRLTLDKIYEKTSKEAEDKKISGNDVAIVWLACFVFAFIAFFVLTAISFIIDIIVGDKNNTSILTVIIPVFQIGVPIFFLAFGWLIGIVYSYIKRNKKRNR